MLSGNPAPKIAGSPLHVSRNPEDGRLRVDVAADRASIGACSVGERGVG
jgi:hypothetical protein